MSNSPIQIVLNPQNFNGERKKGGGGESTDFYADRDGDFRVHKQKVQEQLLSVKKIIEESPYAQVSYAKVILEQSALAKSHRPTKSLFKRETTPIVGGGDLGELYVQLTPQTINQMVTKVGQAEESCLPARWRKDPSF